MSFLSFCFCRSEMRMRHMLRLASLVLWVHDSNRSISCEARLLLLLLRVLLFFWKYTSLSVFPCLSVYRRQEKVGNQETKETVNETQRGDISLSFFVPTTEYAPWVSQHEKRNLISVVSGGGNRLLFSNQNRAFLGKDIEITLSEAVVWEIHCRRLRSTKILTPLLFQSKERSEFFFRTLFLVWIGPGFTSSPESFTIRFYPYPFMSIVSK